MNTEPTINRVQPYIFLLLSFAFGFGFVLTLIFGYYDYQILINTRNDLIARLDFLAKTTGLLFFPISVIPVVTITVIATRTQKLKGPTVIMSLCGLALFAALYYTERMDNFIYKSDFSLGVTLLVGTIILFFNKTIIERLMRLRNGTRQQ
jgi:hypothetical protein